MSEAISSLTTRFIGVVILDQPCRNTPYTQDEASTDLAEKHGNDVASGRRIGRGAVGDRGERRVRVCGSDFERCTTVNPS